jgi:hypothetical protein
MSYKSGTKKEVYNMMKFKSIFVVLGATVAGIAHSSERVFEVCTGGAGSTFTKIEIKGEAPKSVRASANLTHGGENFGTFFIKGDFSEGDSTDPSFVSIEYFSLRNGIYDNALTILYNNSMTGLNGAVAFKGPKGLHLDMALVCHPFSNPL